MNANTENLSRTFDFGLSVEVLHKMEICNLVRFSGQDVSVDSNDLAPVQRIQSGLTTPRSAEWSCPESVRFLHARVATTW